MRRRLALLSTTVLGLLLLAGPAFAAGAGEGSAKGEEDLWTGLIYAFFGGLILGVVAFIDSSTGSNSLDDLHESH